MSNPQIGFYRSLLGQSIPPTPPFNNQYSMLFDGIDEWFYASKNPAYYNTSIVSISLWFKTTNTATRYLYTTSRQYVRLQAGNQFRFLCYYGPTATNDSLMVTAPTTWSDGNWHHILAVMDTVLNKQEVFYDGASIGSRTPSAAGLSAELSFAVGSNQGTGYYVDGNIDEVARWHDTNQSANIGAIYNGGTPPDLSLLATQPTNWWRMGENGNWGGISWDLTSQGIDNATDLRSQNMEIGDRVADTPP
jgi:hypothetical protein